MGKRIADYTRKIEASYLRKLGYFKGNTTGRIDWGKNSATGENRVGIMVVTLGGENYMNICYIHRGAIAEEDNYFDYKISLVTTPCRYGGKRYWFLCPLSSNGRYCGRRIGVLYKSGNYFGCRYCHDLTYESRNVGGKLKRFGRIISTPELEEIELEVKRTHYRGVPTKKYLRFLNKKRKFIAVLSAIALNTKRVL